MPALWAQDFTLTVAVTPETCDGNGALTFTVQNADPGAAVNYKVYLLPDTTNAISDSEATGVTGLQSGTYLVVATQVVNGTTFTDEEEVVIDNNVVPLNYYISSKNALCGYDGNMEVYITSGTAVTYEIINGPVTAPPQTSGVFDNLPAGTYEVRVTDNCGFAVVKTRILFTDGPILTVTDPGFPDSALPDCDHLTITHMVAAQTYPEVGIPYPLTAHYTVYPPDGSTPIEYTTVISSGNPDFAQLNQVIPFYYDTPYYVDLILTDPCGVEYKVLNSVVNQHLIGVMSFVFASCGEYFMKLNVFKYGEPYTVNFTSTPAGFDPEILNTQYPGPFSANEIIFGDLENTVPFGIYEYEITDSCGRTFYGSDELEVPDDPEPTILPYNSDCNGGFGGFEAFITDYIIASVKITEAPQQYIDMLPNGLPSDISANINDEGKISINGLPPGDYTLEITDTCGTIYIREVIIPPFANASVGAQGRPDCTPGMGTVRLSPSPGPFTSVTIADAPAAFIADNPLPYDASYNINANGSFYMDNLPPGNYQFVSNTECVTDYVTDIPITAYEVTLNDVYITRYCGSFDLSLFHESNGVAFVSFWLQKLVDPVNNVWGHPSTGEVYPEGEEPDEENSLELTNNSTLSTQFFTGTFRVVKYFLTYGSGNTATTKNCVETLYEFNFTDTLVLDDIIRLTCVGNDTDIQVNVEGVTPITYAIIKKNGQPFYIDNGENNIFYGLENAQYTLHVEDPCGNVIEPTFSISELPSLVNATDPPSLETCDEGNDETETFDLSVQDAIILNGQDPATFMLTYHHTVEDAEAGTNPLPDVITSGPTTIYARVSHISDYSCYALASFEINLWQPPVIEMEEIWPVCEGEEVTITAQEGYVSYEWSNGETTPSITVMEEGSYTVNVKDENGCTGTKTVTVIQSAKPSIATVEIKDWTDHDNVLTVLVNQTEGVAGNFEYSLNGIVYQESNTFTGLTPGMYVVYVRDRLGCGTDLDTAYLLTYPKFFTPNGDTINETWRIQFSAAEPELMTFIYDRYGKLITGFDVNSIGWDGTFNGKPLPSTDYWFVVKRQDGKEYRGHFSLIR
ncbi:T9SS type B sorting domain-containing protein [Flavobacterium rhizosphaerae]|uniref:T9SS type B sorting domain-containing protein n=1 Tax=Flavobacterium rhizosphaerae TaxID=3163298 RepID=A0ABW8YTW8_9FLAO